LPRSHAANCCPEVHGPTILTDIIRLDSLDKADPDELIARIAPTLQALIDVKG
jgi:hypothetical protein